MVDRRGRGWVGGGEKHKDGRGSRRGRRGREVERTSVNRAGLDQKSLGKLNMNLKG